MNCQTCDSERVNAHSQWVTGGLEQGWFFCNACGAKFMPSSEAVDTAPRSEYDPAPEETTPARRRRSSSGGE